MKLELLPHVDNLGWLHDAQRVHTRPVQGAARLNSANWKPARPDLMTAHSRHDAFTSMHEAGTDDRWSSLAAGATRPSYGRRWPSRSTR